MWFRSDLRIADNPALLAASLFGQVVALFVISPMDFVLHDWAPAKVDLVLRQLKLLQKSLNSYGIPMVTKIVEKRKEIPETVIHFCQSEELEAIFFNEEYEVDESRRDNKVKSLCEKSNINISTFHDQCIVQPGKILTKEGKPYSVFSPFRKNWYTKAHSSILSDFPLQNSVEMIQLNQEIPEFISGFEMIDLNYAKTVRDNWPSGEEAAHSRLKTFVERQLFSYDEARDFPEIDATSKLSAYLSVGIISAKQCFLLAFNSNGKKIDSGNRGCVSWMSELCWRDFYRHVMFHFPRVSMNEPFKLETKKIVWIEDEDAFKKWCQGKTGFPIVDAAMRMLNATGWMHNRLRMITAMFLTKDLLIDWRKGEKYFMTHLIDGDLASNNGGWQWSASTGTDSQPYFRVFNPYLQSKKFDPKGVFIRKWIPELKNVGDNFIHEPHKFSGFDKLNYPPPIVDHAEARIRAINAFKSVSTHQ